MYNKNVRYNKNKKVDKKRSRVTVCIAAIHNGNAVLGASDRMVTASDIEFQPPQSKIWQITSSIVVMTAGDSNIQTQVYSKTLEIVFERIKSNPQKWVAVVDVADIYSNCFLNLKTKLSEKEILSPHGLTHETFIARQKEMTPDFIERITYKIERFSIGIIETIITGVDETGPHIFVIRNGKVSCADKIGFDSIGIGSNHALSHFMLSAYTGNASVSKALLTIHHAKKNSEVSPGVGEQTDMFNIGPKLGSYLLISQPGLKLDIVKDLNAFYDECEQQKKVLDENNEKKIADYIKRLETPPSTAEQQTSSSLSPSASPSPQPEKGS